MDIDALLLDLDGTLYVGDSPVPGAVDAIRGLARRGVPRRYLTNTTRRSRRAVAASLEAMGFPIEEDEIFTAPVAAAAWLRERGIGRVALYLPKATHEDFAGLEVVRPSPEAGRASSERPVESADAAGAAPEAVVVGDLGESWDFATLNRAFRQLMDGARLVAVHRNRYWRAADGLSLDAGPFVAALEYATGRAAELIGKPSAAFFHLAASALGVPRDRIAVVGDDVESDVGGARAAGLRGVLVRTGKFREERLRESGVEPDAVIDSVVEVERLV